MIPGQDNDRVIKGAFIIGFGILLLLYKMHFPIPHWIFSWEAILIAIGFYIGVKSRFENIASYILIGIGSIFLWDEVTGLGDLHQYITPIIIMAIGALVILKPRRKWNAEKWKSRWNYRNNYTGAGSTTSATGNTSTANEFDAEFLDINAVFGGVKRSVVSKNFKGGDVNCFMGGAEINLLQADISQPVVLEINAVFGGAKIVVPSNWDIKIEPTAVLGGIDDKRNMQQVISDPNKVLIIKGTCVFGGIEIRNF